MTPGNEHAIFSQPGKEEGFLGLRCGGGRGQGSEVKVRSYGDGVRRQGHP